MAAAREGFRGFLSRFAGMLECAVKRPLFRCRMCGQCLLRGTGLICPMTCPKGLRNGPCGGTLDGRCEVDPERPCVWIGIHERRNPTGSSPAMPLHAPFDPSLLGTSSFVNLATGADRATRLPVLIPEAGSRGSARVARTASRLERTLRSGARVFTAEIRSPRTRRGLAGTVADIAALVPVADALNTTSHHGGVRTIPSLEVAGEVRRAGGEPIPQICGRDVDPAAYLGHLVAIGEAGMSNVCA